MEYDKKNYHILYSADLQLSRQRLEIGKSAEYTRRIINIYITKQSCDKFFEHYHNDLKQFKNKNQ